MLSLTIIICLMLSALCSAASISFLSISHVELRKLEKSKSIVDNLVNSIARDSKLLVYMLQTVKIFCYAFSLMALLVCFDWLNDDAMLYSIVVGLSFVFVVFLFCEVVPQRLGISYPLSLSRLVAFPSSVILFFSKNLLRITNLKSKLESDSDEVTMERMEQVLDLSQRAKMSEEGTMLREIVRFGEECVRDVMTDRGDVLDVDIETPFSEVIKVISENKYSRIPVYSGSKDNIKGVLYIKDLLAHLGKSDKFRWQSLIRPPYFVPETKMVDDLLVEFQRRKVHIALVVDEYGGSSGLVTLEDIIEEIVGEINDEYDEEVESYKKIDANTYLFDAKISLFDFCQVVGLSEDYFDDIDNDIDSLAGLVLCFFNTIPQQGQRHVFKNLSFEAVKVSKRRVVLVKVEILSQSEGESSTSIKQINLKKK